MFILAQVDVLAFRILELGVLTRSSYSCILELNNGRHHIAKNFVSKSYKSKKAVIIGTKTQNSVSNAHIIVLNKDDRMNK